MRVEAGTRQAHDEDRVWRLAAAALPAGEKGRGDHGFLQMLVTLGGVRAVGGLRFLQRVAAFVVREGVRVVAAVFQRLAEREAEVDAVGQAGGGRCFLRAHPGDLVIEEAICLEVGEAPIRVTETGGHVRGTSVGFDCFLLAAQGFQRVANREVQVRGVRCFGQQVLVDGDRLVVIGQREAGGGVDRAVVPVAGFGAQQDAGFFQRLCITVALQQHVHVFMARQVVAGREGKHAFQQELRVVEDLQLDADARQQAHRFHVRGVGFQEAAYDAFRLVRFAIGEHAGGGDHRRRQGAQLGHVAGGVLRLRRAAGGAVQYGERIPACRQSGI